MSQDQPAGPADAGTEGPGSTAAVVEWGAADARPPGPLARALAALRADPRVAALVAGLAALAVAGSLFSEWRVWTIQQSLEISPEFAVQRVMSGVLGLSSVGPAYLVGALALCGCVTLALFGTGPIRHNARLAGLTTAGVMIAVLASTAVYIEEIDDVYGAIALQAAAQSYPAITSTVTFGRGIYLAFAGVAAMALALWLASPSAVRPPRAGSVAKPAERTEPGEPGAGNGETAPWEPEQRGGGWPWRSGPAGRPTGDPGGPVDLTVEPATPFLPPAKEDRAH